MLASWLGIVAALAQEPAPVATAIHHSEIDRIVAIPSAFSEPPPAYLRCMVRVQVDQGGVPTSTSVKGCEEPWASQAAAAAMQGRWQLREGQVAPLSFVVPVEGRPLVPGGSVRTFRVVGPATTLAILALGEVTCSMRVGITAEGAVDSVTVAEACPEPLRGSLPYPVLRWQVEPWLVDGVAVPILTDLTYTANVGGVAPFHHSEVEVRRRVMPTFPDAARRLYPKGTEVLCKVRIFIDVTGTPYEARPEPECPEVFREPTQEAMLDWRWYPAKIEGQAVKAQFLMNVKYQLD